MRRSRAAGCAQMSTRAIPALLSALACAGCAALPFHRGATHAAIRDLSEGRLTQVEVVVEDAGSEEMLFIAIPKKRRFLQGFIKGLIMDSSDNPVPELDVVAQIAAPQAAALQAGERPPSATFGSAKSDANGQYLLPFRVELAGGRVDIRGMILYAVNWAERCREGKGCWQPIEPKSTFRLFFERADGTLILAEGTPRVKVHEVFAGGANSRQEP